VPACGFALDLDELMGFTQLKEIPPPKVLIQNESDELEGWKLSFEVADSLRRAGYIAELEQKPTVKEGFRWQVKIQSQKKPPFLVTDVIRHRTIKANSIEEVLKSIKSPMSKV
jgi:ribosomal protein S8